MEHVAGKKGPEKRELKLGEFVPWHNARVSVATLICLAALLVAQVVAGIPLSTPTILCCASAVFASAGVMPLGVRRERSKKNQKRKRRKKKKRKKKKKKRTEGRRRLKSW